MFSPERKLKALLSRANKIGARFAVIIGENEIAKGVVVLRDLQCLDAARSPGSRSFRSDKLAALSSLIADDFSEAVDDL